MKRQLFPMIFLLAGTAALLAAAQDVPGLFVTFDRCLACHNGLTTAGGEDISFGIDWRSSMMANSARDPYWQAAVRREVMLRPEAAAVIENECSACHMPMPRFTANAVGRKGEVFSHLPLILAQSPVGLLTADGVSCSMCHQIQKDNFGKKESFTAGFVVDKTTPFPDRHVYGPFKVDKGHQSLMNSASLFIPMESAHVQESELCATCHTLFTHALGDKGEVIGEFPEQVPYLEWKHSSFRNTKSCQSCHMPVIEGEAAVSSVMGVKREAVSRHVFRGGNFFMPRVFNRHRGELAVKALPQELDATSSRTVSHLQSSAARISFEAVEIRDGRLEAQVSIQNMAGHKLPSAYPSRRAWIHFQVTDGSGRTVFESGRPLSDGSISGNDNDSDMDKFEPHYERISSADEVQIYEPILGDPDGRVTTVLLTASQYLKDNRVLPNGFDKATADGDIAVRGGAAEDKDFVGGSDKILYSVALDSADGPLKVRAALWYQPIGHRWAQNLSQERAEETDRFIRYYNEMASASALLITETERAISR
ncbi:MAG: hypothetical protein JXE07_04000 [Candidatus Aminicenantes bacterium]|nr:hypothetical protein [Candidatus Aminicenantes bacterium]